MDIKEFVLKWILRNADNDNVDIEEEIKKAISTYHEVDNLLDTEE